MGWCQVVLWLLLPVLIRVNTELGRKMKTCCLVWERDWQAGLLRKQL